MVRHRVHPNLVVYDLDRKSNNVSVIRIEATTTSDVEASLVPDASYNIVFNHTGLQWVSAVGTSIMHGMNCPIMVENGDGMVFAGDDYTASSSQLHQQTHFEVSFSQRRHFCSR